MPTIDKAQIYCRRCKHSGHRGRVHTGCSRWNYPYGFWSEIIPWRCNAKEYRRGIAGWWDELLDDVWFRRPSLSDVDRKIREYMAKD